MTETPKKKSAAVPRPPVVAVMGHIDHGKTTLLDSIRKTNVAEKEAGGITQGVSAHEISFTAADGKTSRIAFLDTPGHEAFAKIRSRGVRVADLAVLVVSAEDGVKPQTVEALSYIKEAKLPFIVAVTKTDKPGANTERVKQGLTEHEVYVEGYGGTIPLVEVSGKTGAGIPELLEMIVLMAELEGKTADPGRPAEGIVLEASVEKTRGVSATLIVKDGTLAKGMTVEADGALSPVRAIENTHGKKIEAAGPGSPVRIAGWNALPPVGSVFRAFAQKKEAEAAAAAHEAAAAAAKQPAKTAAASERVIIPLIVKADAAGSLEAIEHECRKIETKEAGFKLIYSGTGDINESDAKLARGSAGAFIAGFNVGISETAAAVIGRSALSVETFDVIYKLIDRLAAVIRERTPRIETQEIRGKAKILKLFGGEKEKPIIGGKVLEGVIKNGDEFKIFRRETEIGNGKIRELRHLKEKTAEVGKDSEFGAMIQSSIAIAPGDRIESFVTVLK